MPMMDDTEVHMHGQQQKQCADAGGGQGRQDRDGMDQALIEHTQDDVDHDQCQADQQGCSL